jgi:hypothetical protein
MGCFTGVFLIQILVPLQIRRISCSPYREVGRAPDHTPPFITNAYRADRALYTTMPPPELRDTPHPPVIATGPVLHRGRRILAGKKRWIAGQGGASTATRLSRFSHNQRFELRLSAPSAVRRSFCCAPALAVSAASRRPPAGTRCLVVTGRPLPGPRLTSQGLWSNGCPEAGSGARCGRPDSAGPPTPCRLRGPPHAAGMDAPTNGCRWGGGGGCAPRARPRPGARRRRRACGSRLVRAGGAGPRRGPARLGPAPAWGGSPEAPCV